MIFAAIFLLLVFLFSLISRWAKSSIISAPMIFTFFGILISLYVPELSEMEVKNQTILLIGEITLAVVIFSDATRISLRRVMRETDLPARLLGIGMPLTILFGTFAAVLLLSGLEFWEAAILATILAPTDASLGAAVVSSKLVPTRIRQTLNVESGLNDGLSVPFLMLFIALSGVGAHGEQQSWLGFTAQQIGLGIVAGIVVGWLGGWLMSKAVELRWIENSAKQLALLSLGILSWWLAEKGIGGNGFIAAYVAGGMVRIGYENAKQHMDDFDESWGDLLIYFIFYFFGTLATPFLGIIGEYFWIYAILSLTLVRMVPVAISLLKSKLQPVSVLFIGWFGPRGLASVVLGLIYLEELEDFNVNPIIIYTVIVTVALSILAHGISATPLSKWYANKVAWLSPNAPERAGEIVKVD